MNELEKASGNNQLSVITDLLPELNFNAMNQFYAEVENIVKNSFIKGYHYGPAYEQKPGKDAPPNILYKKGAQFFIDRCGLMFEDAVEIIEELNRHTTYHVKTRMFTIGNRAVISQGEGFCSTAEGRFSYIPKDKIIPHQVREQASLRARKDAIERFFNLSRFFITEKQSAGQSVKSPEKAQQRTSEPRPAQTPGQPEKPQPQQSQPPKKENKRPDPLVIDLKDRKSLKFDWDYQPEDLNNESWFIKQISECLDQQELFDFMAEFERDMGCFHDSLQQNFKNAANTKFQELGKIQK